MASAVRTMNKQEVADLIEQFDGYLEETQHDLETLRQLAETEVSNIFRGGIGLVFDIFDIRIFPSKYLLKITFGIVDTEIYTVSFRDNIIDIWFKDASAKMFMYEIDLNRQTLKLWEYYILFLILKDKDFEKSLNENIGAINAVNASLANMLRFLKNYEASEE